jgi:phosphatidate cytidylyltransferase
MHEYLLPYLLLMAHFVSGGLWLILINRRLDRDGVKKQWTKYVVYLLLVNLLWFCIVWFEKILPVFGGGIILLASVEWWRAVKVLEKRVWLILVFLLIAGGFLRFLYLDKNWLLYTFFVVFLFDGSCQVAGQLVGKRPLLPRISSRKTLEGLAGGAVITLATTLLVRGSFSFGWGRLILTTCLIMAAAFLGDLLASAIKRVVGIVEFGRAIPGHGGIIDRFDSLMMAGSAISLLSLIQHVIK